MSKMKLTDKDRSDLYDYVYFNGDTPNFVYEEFAEDMPYGTQKCRTDDPDNWLADRIEQVEERFFDELEQEKLKRAEKVTPIK